MRSTKDIEELCCMCGTDDVLKKKQFQFGGDFGGPLLKAPLCSACATMLHFRTGAIETLMKKKPHLFGDWSV